MGASFSQGITNFSKLQKALWLKSYLPLDIFASTLLDWAPRLVSVQPSSSLRFSKLISKWSRWNISWTMNILWPVLNLLPSPRYLPLSTYTWFFLSFSRLCSLRIRRWKYLILYFDLENQHFSSATLLTNLNLNEIVFSFWFL